MAAPLRKRARLAAGLCLLLVKNRRVITVKETEQLLLSELQQQETEEEKREKEPASAFIVRIHLLAMVLHYTLVAVQRLGNPRPFHLAAQLPLKSTNLHWMACGSHSRSSFQK